MSYLMTTSQTISLGASGRVVATVLLVAGIGLGSPARAAARFWPSPPYPEASALRDARTFALSRGTSISFAVLRPGRPVRGLAVNEQFSSASASKALLLAAELRRLRDEGSALDEGTRRTLESMITYSDNAAAGVIYARVGDAGMEEVAARAGMESFATIPGYWGGAQITAADMARFYLRLRRNLVRPHRRFGLRALESVTESQRWGIPQGAGRGWRIWFKGGWRPPATEETSGPVTHQAALLRYRNGQRLALAVLTEESPGTYGGFEAIAGIARRLLRPPPPGPGRWPAG